MSTMTLRKRIALVAVTALGAGLLSVVAVPSANAAVNANSTTGAAGASASVGLLASAGTGTTQTAVLLATGAISTTGAAGASGSTMTATVTGGRFTATDGGTISGTSSAYAQDDTVNDALSLLAVPNAGATTMVITYSGLLSSVYTVTERITVTIVATSAYNVYSPTYSTVYFGGSGTYTATTDATSSNYSKASAGVVSGKITLADSYGNALTSSNTSLVTATATGGALVKLTDLSAAGDRETDYTTLTGSAIDFNVQQADVDVPLNSTLTISVGGTVVATKTLVIRGEVAKVTASSPKIGKVGGGNADIALIKYEDSAGNQVLPSSGTSVVSSTVGSVITTASIGTYSTSTSDAYAGNSLLTATCALGGTQKGLQVQHLNTSGSVVKSNTWDAGCADVPYTMTASFDKASYKRGEVATLTLAVKDSKGNAANAYDTIATAAEDLTITGGPGTLVTDVAAGDKPSRATGAKTYQFTVTLEDGDYNAVVVPTTIKGVNALQSNITVPFSVTSTAGVSNADVLKAIVSLIASINKQIAALQKALLRR